MTEDRRPTVDEIRRVRFEECRTGGHRWRFVHVADREDPISILCSRCGRQCRVISSEVDP